MGKSKNYRSEMKNDVALSVHRGQCRNVLKPSKALLFLAAQARGDFPTDATIFFELMITNYTIILLHEIIQKLRKLS